MSMDTLIACPGCGAHLQVSRRRKLPWHTYPPRAPFRRVFCVWSWHDALPQLQRVPRRRRNRG
jgi:hypothetical protein